MASVFKLGVLAELFRAADAGALDLRERRRHRRRLGMTVIGQLRDPVDLCSATSPSR